MKVYVISMPVIDTSAWEQFTHDEGILRERMQAGDAETLVEYAGRLCYMSYGKGRRTNEDFIDNIIKSQHFSVLEHANFTLFITGISRSCSHELVRHRHFSFSQLSQRYVDESKAEMIMPPALNGCADDSFIRAINAARVAYEVIVTNLEMKYKDEPNATLRRKMARQAARAVLPNAVETKIAVSGNARTWREFISKRATIHADPEIRALAEEVRRQLVKTAPALFGDLVP